MVALQILALSVRVRILLSQLFKKALPEYSGRAFSLKTVFQNSYMNFLQALFGAVAHKLIPFVEDGF